MSKIGKYNIDELPAILADHLNNPLFRVDMALSNIQKSIELDKNKEFTLEIVEAAFKAIESLKLNIDDIIKKRIEFE